MTNWKRYIRASYTGYLIQELRIFIVILEKKKIFKTAFIYKSGKDKAMFDILGRILRLVSSSAQSQGQ